MSKAERFLKEKRNPQDATLRNIRALKKRVSVLEALCERLIFCLERGVRPSPGGVRRAAKVLMLASKP